jgi:phosphohistidine phosphatase SixA
MHLYMIRHGQSYVNLRDWQDGNIDAGLTELGQQQAAALAEWIPSAIPQVDALYASTMARARETAEPLAKVYTSLSALTTGCVKSATTASTTAPGPATTCPNTAKCGAAKSRSAPSPPPAWTGKA